MARGGGRGGGGQGKGGVGRVRGLRLREDEEAGAGAGAWGAKERQGKGAKGQRGSDRGADLLVAAHNEDVAVSHGSQGDSHTCAVQ